jgi:hypothetical protein
MRILLGGQEAGKPGSKEARKLESQYQIKAFKRSSLPA